MKVGVVLIRSVSVTSPKLSTLTSPKAISALAGSLEIFSYTGCIVLLGPDHFAKKSTTTIVLLDVKLL